VASIKGQVSSASSQSASDCRKASIGKGPDFKKGFLKSIFTEGRKGNEETDVSLHQISKQMPLLPLMTEFP
jgi:hypothetical protein